MSAFDKVIGYASIKQELLQISDMIHNKEVYMNLGAKLPKGILLYGNPGLGKTLIAKCFIEECGLDYYVVRKNKNDIDFIEEISETFIKAKENSPAIVFLDDIDKFANEDEHHCDADEYVAVQAGIDEVKNYDVFVIATANRIQKLPKSLIRSGRFDRKIKFYSPNSLDAYKIIEHYLSDKKVSTSVNMEDLSKMISYSSCAELETILNEAAIVAAYERKDSIEMEDMIKAVLRMEYDSPDDLTKLCDDDIKKTALHEAGHIVVSEVISPGSVGLASLRSAGRGSTGGFTHRCEGPSSFNEDILVSLAGKVAVELFFSDNSATGCKSDINRAITLIRESIMFNGSHGFGMIDVTTDSFTNLSESMNSRVEAVVQAELETYMFKTRNILQKYMDFLSEITQALIDEETLLYSDIEAIRESVDVNMTVV